MIKFSKFLASLAIVFGMCGSISAQTAVETTRVFDNLYFGPKVGVSTNLHFNPVFPVNTSVGFKFGKMVNPVLGFNVDGTMLFGSADYKGNRWSYKNAVRGTNLGGNVTLDLPNMFGTQKNRAFTVMTETGLGWFHSFNNGSDQNDLSAKTGIIGAWNISKAIQFYVEPAIYWNLTPNDATPYFNSSNAQFAVEIGFNYRFKNKNGKRGFVYYNVGTMNDSINNLRSQLEDSKAKAAKVVNTVIHDTVYVEQPVQFFAQGDYTLNNDSVYDIYKADDTVSVYGYASPEGSKSFNMKLSQKRADVVADYLKSKGIIVTEAKGLGVVGKNSNRIAIVRRNK